MKRLAPVLLSGLLVCLASPAATHAHSPYGKALKEKYELRLVSCYACHAKGKDEETGRPLGKEHLNDFGGALKTVLKDTNHEQELEDAKQLSRDERKAVDEKVATEFTQAFEQIENRTATDGQTWKELILSGDFEGIRLRR